MDGRRSEEISVEIVGHTRTTQQIGCCGFQHYDAGIYYTYERAEGQIINDNRAQVFSNDFADPNYNEDDDIGAWFFRPI